MMLSFNEKVYRAAKKIPRGKVATYRWIANKINNPLAVRAVGNALNRNPYAPQVPCHRVICSDGRLGGFAGGAQKKEKLLRKEGVIVKNKRIDLLKFGFR